MRADNLPQLLPRRLAPPGGLAGDYLDQVPAVRALFPEGKQTTPRAGRLEAGAFLCTTPGARRKLGRILAGDGVLVTTGQQPVLFLGPLFVLYKALTAIAEAARIEARTGRPALASFWIASDDHDWDEVASCRVLDREDEIRALSVSAPEGRARRAVGASPLPGEVLTALDDLAAALGETDFSEEVLQPLRDAYRPGVRFGTAFGEALTDLLRDRDLVLLDSAREDVRRASAPFLRVAIERRVEVQEALESGRRQVEETGHRPTLHPPEGGTQVFLDGQGGRRHLIAESGELTTGPDGVRSGVADVLQTLETDPLRFSPAAALRPVLESWLLPVARTVLGPGEIAYWSQLAPLFETLSVPMPVVGPRGAWFVVEDRIRSVLERAGAAPQDLSDGGGALERRLVEESRPRRTEDALDVLRAQLGQGLGRIDSAAGDEVPGLHSAVGKAKASVFGALSELQKAIDARVREREEVELARVRKAARHLYPEGRPQERRQSPYYYLVRYGRAFVDALASAASVAAAGEET